MKHSVVERLV